MAHRPIKAGSLARPSAPYVRVGRGLVPERTPRRAAELRCAALRCAALAVPLRHTMPKRPKSAKKKKEKKSVPVAPPAPPAELVTLEVRDAVSGSFCFLVHNLPVTSTLRYGRSRREVVARYPARRHITLC